MYEEYIRRRLDELRLQKGISERKLSLDIGHSNTYIHNISNGKALPSLGEFLYLCEYFGITPKDFFDKEGEPSLIRQEAKAILDKVSEEEIPALIPILTKFIQE